MVRLFLVVEVTQTQMINEVTLWCPSMLQLLVFWMLVPKGRAFYVQRWLVKEYAKLVGNQLQIWSGSFTRKGGGSWLSEATASDFEKKTGPINKMSQKNYCGGGI